MAVAREVVDPQRLTTMPLFATLDDEQLVRVAELSEAVSVPAGTTVNAEQNFAYEFFVIEEGKAEVVRDGRRLAELGPGDFFGEIGLLITGRRTASVVSLTPMRRPGLPAPRARAARLRRERARRVQGAAPAHLGPSGRVARLGVQSRRPGRLAQLGEHQLDKLGVTGSSPVPPIQTCAAMP